MEVTLNNPDNRLPWITGHEIFDARANIWQRRGNAGFYLDYDTNIVYCFYGSYDGDVYTNSFKIVDLNTMKSINSGNAPSLSQGNMFTYKFGDIVYNIFPKANLASVEYNVKTNTCATSTRYPSAFGTASVNNSSSTVGNIGMRLYNGKLYIVGRTGGNPSINIYDLNTKTYSQDFITIPNINSLVNGFKIEGDNAYFVDNKAYDSATKTYGMELITVNLKTSTISKKNITRIDGTARISSYNKFVEMGGKHNGKIFLHSSRTRALNYPHEVGYTVIDIAKAKVTFQEDVYYHNNNIYEMTNTPFLWKNYLLSFGGYETSSDDTLYKTKAGYLYPEVFK